MSSIWRMLIGVQKRLPGCLLLRQEKSIRNDPKRTFVEHEPFGESDPRCFSQAAIWNKCLALWAEKKDRLPKKTRFSTTWTVLQRRWIHEMFDQSSGIECSFQSSDHPKILKTSNEDRVKCQTLVETNV